MCVSEIEGHIRRGRSVVRWKDWVKEYMHERGVDRGEDMNKQGGSVWIGRGRGSFAILFVIPGRNEMSETITYIDHFFSTI